MAPIRTVIREYLLKFHIWCACSDCAGGFYDPNHLLSTRNYRATLKTVTAETVIVGIIIYFIF